MRLVIFDCDGTLVDSAEAIVATMNVAFAGEGLPPPDAAAVRGVIGLSLEIAIASLVGEDAVLTDRLAAAYRAEFLANGRARAHGLFPGATAAILELAGRDDHLLAIATGKSRRGLDAVLAHHDFTSHFAATATADDAPSKPHPGMVEKCMAEAGAAPGDTIVIGDTTFDIEMARNAGAAAIGVCWGSHAAGELLAAGAHSVVLDFPRLVPAIDGYYGTAA